MSKNKAISSIILWSVISAAFIGPGSVTTAARAGSLFQLNLLWAVTFATLGCIFIQEISARLTIVSGITMGQALARKYGNQKSAWLKYVLGIPVIIGCAAYEAGNILGAVSGLNLMSGANIKVLTVIVTLLVGVILWTDKREIIFWLMASLVGLMGVAFLVLAADTHFTFKEYLDYSLIPRIPVGSELLALGLVGTTIVPYNVFLGSGISKGQTVPLMRLGLTISVVIGGLITATILIAGTTVKSFTNFNELADALVRNGGAVSGWILGVGLFAAAFGSAITSPYAASIIASSVFDWKTKWQKLTWIIILMTGFAFGMSGIKPVPLIVAAQAVNGLILPLITAYLILLINDSNIIPSQQQHSLTYNIILLLTFGGVLLMGLTNIDREISTRFNFSSQHFWGVTITTIVTTCHLAYKVFIETKSRPGSDKN
ncbi:Nramp family divalent metal transporter [soil metagenome]